MRSLSVKALKETPIYLVGAIIIAILLFSSLVIPTYRKIVLAKKVLKIEQSNIEMAKHRMEILKNLPEFNIHLDTKEDILLAIKSVVERNGYQLLDVTDIVSSKDKVGDVISFSINISGYRSISKVVRDLEFLRTLFPLYYSGYEIENRNIKVDAKCYIRPEQ